MPQENSIHPQDIKGGIPKNAVIIDVRTQAEHDQVCLDCAHLHIPMDRIDVEALKRDHNITPETPLLILCQAGVRAQRVASYLQGAGFTNACVIDGGLAACRACGVGVRAGGGRSVLPLERQVRIAVGVMALTGFVLGVFVHSGFHALSGFAGAGLILSGVTGWCGIAMLITRAPWNACRAPNS